MNYTKKVRFIATTDCQPTDTLIVINNPQKLVSGTGFISGRSPGGHADEGDSPQVMNIARMPEVELDKEFEKMLDNMNLTDLKKEPLRRLGPGKKREMLTMHNKTHTRAAVSVMNLKLIVHCNVTEPL